MIDALDLYRMRDGNYVNVDGVRVQVTGPFTKKTKYKQYLRVTLHIHEGGRTTSRLRKVEVGYEVWLRHLATGTVDELISVARKGELKSLHEVLPESTKCTVCGAHMLVDAKGQGRARYTGKKRFVCSLSCRGKLGAVAALVLVPKEDRVRRSRRAAAVTNARRRDRERYETWLAEHTILNAGRIYDE